MRFYTVLASRPQYYDRSPLTISNDYSAIIAPAGSTVRWTYTVPAARSAFIELSSVQVLRMTAAGAVGQAVAILQFIPNGGSANALFRADIITNAVGDQQSKAVPSIGLLQAGDALKAITVDTSTTGTVEYDISMKATEFST